MRANWPDPFGPVRRMRIHQPVRMMDALGVARDLGADDAGGIGLQLGAAHPADGVAVDHLDIEGAGRRAIVRTGGMPDVDLGMLVHTPIGTIKCRDSRAHLSGMHAAKPAAGHASGAQIGPAIGVDRLAVDVARARTAQEPHRRGDVFRPAALAADGLVESDDARAPACPWGAACRSAPAPRN